jgi:hypothetical protein
VASSVLSVTVKADVAGAAHRGGVARTRRSRVAHQAPVPRVPFGLPAGDLAFDVTCVGANRNGDIYVGGSSLGMFDGQSPPNGVWVGGWLTQFYAPTPP